MISLDMILSTIITILWGGILLFSLFRRLAERAEDYDCSSICTYVTFGLVIAQVIMCITWWVLYFIYGEAFLCP